MEASSIKIGTQLKKMCIKEKFFKESVQGHQKPSMNMNTARRNKETGRPSHLFDSKYLWAYCYMYLLGWKTHQHDERETQR